MSRHGQVLLTLTAMCVLATKIVLAYRTYGTNDAITFETDIARLESAGPERLYREGVEPVPGHKQPFSHSPPVIHGLLILKRLENESGLPVRFWLRVCCACADFVSLGLVWKIGIRSRAALLLMAIAPASLLISGFHVNTDPVMMCAVLWCAYLIPLRRFAWAGAALGIALSIKLTALIFLPALAMASGAKKSAQMAGLALVCCYGLSLPFIWEFPATIGTSIMSYTGLSKIWGIPAILAGIGAEGIYGWYQNFGKYVALGIVGVAVVVLGNKRRGNDILGTCGLSAAIFLLFTPGFGIQYLVYLVPWLSAERASVTAGYYVISGAFMIAFYTWGSNGFPWYLANFFTSRPMPLHVFFLGLLTWVAIGVVAFRLCVTRWTPLKCNTEGFPEGRISEEAVSNC